MSAWGSALSGWLQALNCFRRRGQLRTVGHWVVASSGNESQGAQHSAAFG